MQAPIPSTDQLLAAKRKRNIVVGCVFGALILICVAITVIYLLVFRPRVYFGNHVMLTVVAAPVSTSVQSACTGNLVSCSTDSSQVVACSQSNCTNACSKAQVKFIKSNSGGSSTLQSGDVITVQDVTSNNYWYFDSTKNKMTTRSDNATQLIIENASFKGPIQNNSPITLKLAQSKKQLGTASDTCIVTDVSPRSFVVRSYDNNDEEVTTQDTYFINAPVYVPQGPQRRFTLIPGNSVDNARATVVASSTRRLTLLTPQLEQHGWMTEGDDCLLWDPMYNKYLYATACTSIKNSASCTASTMNAQNQPYSANTCEWSDNETECKDSSSGTAALVFRVLPKNFAQLIQSKDPKYSYLQGFVFNFSTTPVTPSPTDQDHMMIQQDYYLRSKLGQNQLVFVNMTDSTLDLITTQSAQLTDNSGTAKWQIMK